MNKAIDNIIELGVNLLIAGATVWILLSVIGLGRNLAVAIEQEHQAQERTKTTVEFSGLNGKTITYGEIVELVTYYAGNIDIYVTSTCDGGAILISAKQYTANEGLPASYEGFSITNYSKTICLNKVGYTTEYSYLTAATQALLKSNLTDKFGTGTWVVETIVNGGYVTSTAAETPTGSDVVTGLRFKRIN